MGHQIVLLRMRRSKPKRLDSTSDRMMQMLFSKPSTLGPADQEYLLAAESGDLAAVQRCATEQNVNINCLDQLGRSALELALMGDHTAVVEYLLPRSNMQSLEDGLLYAIGKDNVKMCELILEHPLYKNQRLRLAGRSDGGVYQGDSESPRLRAANSPIVLAAHRNNFYITQLLLLRGDKISPPHDYFCDCIECSNQRVYDSVKYSLSRLNTYRALASPAYLSLSSDDPILSAFQLSHQLAQLAEIEKEYKSEYARLSNQCKDYAVELMDLCQSTEEIVAILNEDGQEEPPEGEEQTTRKGPGLARVKLALKYEQKRFIAHATCQRQLISLWYSGMPWMRHQHMVVKLLSVPAATLLLPIATLVFLLAPGCKFGKIMRSPFVKFLNHTCAYIVFLVLVFMATLREGSGHPWLDMACWGVAKTLPDSVVFILILVWVLGMLLHECRQLFREGPKNYLTDRWNIIDSALIMLYLAYFSLQSLVLVRVIQADPSTQEALCPNLLQWHKYSCHEMSCEVSRALNNYTYCNSQLECSDIDSLYLPRSKGESLDMLSDMNQIADIFFALANVLSFARVAHLLPANEQLGPLLVSFGRMLHDVARFFVVFLLVFLAFLCGLTSLYRVHKCENMHFSRVDRTLASLFWATFGMGDTKASLLDNRYLASNKNLIRTHSTHHPLTTLVGTALFWAYIAGAVVVMLNMLIAMMSNSFQEIYDDRDVEWKFARAKLWSDFFEDGCTLPTPFNLIPNPKYLVSWLLWVVRKIKKTREEPPVQMAYIYARRKNGMTDGDINHVELPAKPETLYQRISKRLIQRYIYKKQSESAEKMLQEDEINELKQDVGQLTTNVDKLRHEIGYIRSNVMAGVKKQNGFRSTSSVYNPRSKVELNV